MTLSLPRFHETQNVHPSSRKKLQYKVCQAALKGGGGGVGLQVLRGDGGPSEPLYIYIYKTVVCVCSHFIGRVRGAALRDRRQSGVQAVQSRLTPAPWPVGAQRSVDAR